MLKIVRRGLAVAIAAILFAYTAAIISGKIPAAQRLDSVHLGLIALAGFAVAILWSPASFSRVKLLEAFGFRLEMLEQVRETQIEQGFLIDRINDVLPLLLPEPEQKHLLNLEVGNTNYEGGGSLRAELRRLRSIGLIAMRDGRTIGDMKNGMKFDLGQYVLLTENGKRWVRWIRDAEEKGK